MFILIKSFKIRINYDFVATTIQYILGILNEIDNKIIKNFNNY
jgi:hypothetical protein